MEAILASMSVTQIVFVAVAVMFAALMRAFSGFGFALMAVPVFSLFLTPGDSVVLAAILTLAVSAITYKSWWGKFSWSDYLPMLAGSLVGTALGVVFLKNVSSEQFQLWIGITVVLACLLLSRLKPHDERGGPTLAGGTGIASGLMNGAFAIPGPPVIVYVMMCISDPARSRAFLMAFFFASNIIAMGMFTAAGVVTAVPFYLFVIAMPVMLFGDRFGAWLFHRVHGSSYRPVALTVSLGVGVAITLRALLA